MTPMNIFNLLIFDFMLLINNLPAAVYTRTIQGVQINMGIKRLFENRLRCPLVDKWQKVFLKRDCMSREIFTKWSAFFVSLTLTETSTIEQLCCYWTNWNVDRFLHIFFNFNGAKMVDHILEFPRVIGFDELILSTRILINSDDVVMRYETKTIKK